MIDVRSDEAAEVSQGRVSAERSGKGIRPMAAASLLYSTFFVFLTLTFPAYFYFLPESGAGDIRPFLLFVYLVGWPLAVVAPSLLMLIRPMRQWVASFDVLYLVAVLMWPLATAAIKIRAAVLWGEPGLDYWGLYPVFILLEVIWPVLVVAHWWWSRIINSEEGQVRRTLRRELERDLRDRTRRTG